MYRFKSCPRCKGDIRLDSDQYGWYEECLQCGYMHDLEKMHVAQLENTKKGKERRVVAS